MPPQAGEQPLRESLDRLVQLYEATGNQDEAAEWRQKLEELKTTITSQKSEKGKP